MPSALKARKGRPSVAEMRADLDKLRKPPARTMEALFDKYYNIALSADPPLKEIEVKEPSVNWRALVMSLPAPQNVQVLGCGIGKIFLAETECVYSGIYRFHVQRLDRTRAVFDFREAFDDPYHQYKDKSYAHDVELALRAGVVSQLIQYKEMQMELVSHISGVALPWERAVVQHFPVTFHTMVDAFLNEVQLKVEQVKLDTCEEHGYRLKDPELLERWRVYHRAQAHYRVISTEEAMEQDHL